jgi:hypothetical protein
LDVKRKRRRSGPYIRRTDIPAHPLPSFLTKEKMEEIIERKR